MIFRGVLERAFGNILCLRGYARLGDLAAVSKSDENYQRSVDVEHIDDVVKFLNGGQYTFFPELILGASLSNLGLSEKEIESFYGVVDTGEAFKFNRLFDIGISTFVKKYSNVDCPRYITASIHNIDRIAYRKPFSRIDGNHRLEAVEKAKDQVKLYSTPFCLVLFRNDDERRRFGTVFFHNINYHAKSIPEEHNLKVILTARDDGGDYVFGDEVLQTEQSFGVHYYYARQFLCITDLSIVRNVAKMAEGIERTLFLRVFELLKDHGCEGNLVEEVKWALSRAESALSKHKFEQYNLGVAVALIYFAVKDSGRDVDAFADWIASNELQVLGSNDADPRWLISVFEKTHRRGPYNVFVAMPFISMSHVTEFNKLFKEVLDELNKKGGADHIRYELTPIMLFRGASQRIDQRLIAKIKACDIFIADITGNNENVIFEVGLAQGYEKPCLLLRADDEKNISKIIVKDEVFEKNWEYVKYVRDGGEVPFDMDKLQYIPYSQNGYYNNIKRIVRNNLPEIVKKLK